MTRINTTVLLDQHRRAVAAALADLQPQSWSPETLPESGGGGLANIRLARITALGANPATLTIRLQAVTVTDGVATYADDGEALTAYPDPGLAFNPVEMSDAYLVDDPESVAHPYYWAVQLGGAWFVLFGGSPAGLTRSVFLDIGDGCQEIKVINGLLIAPVL